jgi:hypothetical protein
VKNFSDVEIPKEIRELVEKMLIYDEEKRMDWETLFRY